MDKLYNEEIKEKFLSNYDNEQTQKTIRNVFQKSELIERVLGKDLYNFTDDEIGKVIENANPHSVSVSKSLGRFISQYISWAMPYRDSNINPLQGVPNEWYSQFIDKSKKVHYSYEEFIDLLEDKYMYNAADKSFLFLLWEGLMGQSFSEIRNLKWEDVNFDLNQIYIRERNQTVTVSDQCIKYIEQTQKEMTYYSYVKNTGEFREKELLPSLYVFKNVKSPRTREGEQITQAVLYTRINSLKNQFNLEYLTPNAIKQSGMIYMAYQLYQEYGKLEYEQFAMIGENYAYSTLTNNGYTYFNTTLMKEFINSQNFKELYDIDVEF